VTSEELRKRATDQYPWHPVETVLEAADEIDRLNELVVDIQLTWDNSLRLNAENRLLRERVSQLETSLRSLVEETGGET
jgi:hypothetical protein